MDIKKRKFVKYGIILLCLIFCWYECGPDPENKRKFKKTLGVELTPDVKDIHYYGDFIGIDFSVYLAFTCDSSTIQRIIKEKGLKLTGDKDMGGLSGYSNWWDQEKINTIRPYKRGDGYKEVCQYLWYDKDNKKAYYQKFSM